MQCIRRVDLDPNDYFFAVPSHANTVVPGRALRVYFPLRVLNIHTAEEGARIVRMHPRTVAPEGPQPGSVYTSKGRRCIKGVLKTHSGLWLATCFAMISP